jgi:hypothetical protein
LKESPTESTFLWVSGKCFWINLINLAF